MNPNSGDSREGFPRPDASLDATDAADPSPIVPPFRSTGTSSAGGENGGRNMSWNIADLLGPAVFRPSTSTPEPAPAPAAEEIEVDELTLVEPVESVESELMTDGTAEDQSWLITEESEDLPFLRLEDEPSVPSSHGVSEAAEAIPDWMSWTESEEATEVAESESEVAEQPSAGWTEEVLTHGGLPMLNLTDPEVGEDESPATAAGDDSVRFAQETEEEFLLEEPVSDLEEPVSDSSEFSPIDSGAPTDDGQGSDTLTFGDDPWYAEPAGDRSAADEEVVSGSESVEEEPVAGAYWDTEDVAEPGMTEFAPAAEEEYPEPVLVRDEVDEESFSAFVEPTYVEPVAESTAEYAPPFEEDEEGSDLASAYVEEVQYDSSPKDLPTAEVGSEGAGADAAIMDVASRLEGIASRLRSGGATGLLSTGGSDPLELLITGFVLGYSQRNDEVAR